MATFTDQINARPQEEIRGVSDWARGLREQINRFAPFNSSVLISGPSGTGKELIARSLHAAGPRAASRFVPIDCASVTGDLMASQLFGHLEGAFTGANHASLGCFRAAHQGTLFLDEIGEMELSLQARLLRVLQERVVVPVGGYDEIPVDVRVVAATNRDLAKEVRAGRFREDLFFRLNVVSLPTQPLADRPCDITPLAFGFVEQLAREGLPHKGISPRALDLLERFSWPGNVRQLKNVLEQAVVGCDGPLITHLHLRDLLAGRVGTLRQGTTSDGSRGQLEGIAADRFGDPLELESIEGAPAPQPAPRPALSDRLLSCPTRAESEWISLAALERMHLLQTLDHTYNNRAAAARLLGLSRQSLLRKIKKHGI